MNSSTTVLGRFHHIRAEQTNPRPTNFHKFLHIILPSFIHYPDANAGKKLEDGTLKHTATDWITGLRGLAAMIVVITHMLPATHPYLYFGYGSNTSMERHIIQLPFLRLIYGGSAMVAVFFIISGYVLSYKSLQLAQSHEWDTLYAHLSSSVLRRAMRLLIPPLIVWLATAAGAQCGLFKHNALTIGSVIWPVTAQPAPSLTIQLQRWIVEIWKSFSPWQWSTAIPNLEYGIQFWTILVELRCSMALYLILIATSRLRRLPRLIVILIFQFYSIACGRWEMFLFLAGMLLSSLHLNQENQHLPSTASTSVSQQPCLLLNFAFLIIGLYLASEPELNANATPGFIFLNSMIPISFPVEDAFRFWLAIGATLIVYSISNIEQIKRAFELSFFQYIGRISFSLYLVHAFIISSIGAWIFESFQPTTGISSSVESLKSKNEIGFWIMICVTVPIMIWVADLYWRFVDVPSVTLTKLIEKSLLRT
jgi:peptidoglycan/LPS O-acetylase OafA/YrhL